MKSKEYYDKLEKDHGLNARRAAESADKLADQVIAGELDFGQAVMEALGAIRISGR